MKSIRGQCWFRVTSVLGLLLGMVVALVCSSAASDTAPHQRRPGHGSISIPGYPAPARGMIGSNGVPVAVSIANEMGSGFQLTPFDYYVQQGDNSPSQGVNCGPASVAMALRYGSALAISPSPQHVRRVYMGLGPSSGRAKDFTGPDDFTRALDFAGAEYREVSGAAGVWDAVHRYHTVILPARMRDVSRGEDVQLAAGGGCPDGKKAYQYSDKVYCYTNSRDVVLGRYTEFSYENGNWDGHIVLVNGVLTDTYGQRYFYVYDPNVFGTSGAKYFCGQTAEMVPNVAMRLMGAMGYSRQCHVEKYLRDIKIIQLWLGGTELARIDNARGYYEMPPYDRIEPLW